MKEGFRRVLQIRITKWNLALWSKSVRQRLQEEVNMNFFEHPFFDLYHSLSLGFLAHTVRLIHHSNG
jgi:hypothetical protein